MVSAGIASRLTLEGFPRRNGRLVLVYRVSSSSRVAEGLGRDGSLGILKSVEYFEGVATGEVELCRVRFEVRKLGAVCSN